MTNRTCSVPDCTTRLNGERLRKGYCPKHYQRVQKYGSPELPVLTFTGKCDQCGIIFSRSNALKKYCSAYCRSWAAFFGPGISKHCDSCGDPMMASKTSSPGGGRCQKCTKHSVSGFDRGCRCDVCVDAKREANMAYKARVKAEHGVNPSTIFKRRYRERTGLRYRMAPSDWIDPKLRLEIYERDDWLCHLCKEPVDRSAHFNDDFAPSLDHLKPRSKGGSDEQGNLKTSHRICNATRRDDELDALEVV